MKLEDLISQDVRDGFEIEYRDYVFHRADRPIIVEKVPYLRDPRTDALYLHAAVAERLWFLTHDEAVPYRQILTDVIAFTESESTHA